MIFLTSSQEVIFDGLSDAIPFDRVFIQASQHKLSVIVLEGNILREVYFIIDLYQSPLTILLI